MLKYYAYEAFLCFTERTDNVLHEMHRDYCNRNHVDISFIDYLNIKTETMLESMVLHERGFVDAD